MFPGFTRVLQLHDLQLFRLCGQFGWIFLGNMLLLPTPGELPQTITTLETWKATTAC